MKFEKITYKMQIREHHLDTFGHVNNAVYLTLFEEARWQFITERGYGLETVRERMKGPVILEVTLKFRQELLNRQHVRIETQATSYKGKIGHLAQQLYNQDEQLCCEAQFVMGFFDMRTRKLIDPSPEWLQALGMLSPSADT